MNENQYLFDTSVWINYWNNKKTKATLLLDEVIPFENSVFLCPTIVQETLQGAKSLTIFNQLGEYFFGMSLLDCGHYKAAFEASKIYFDLRKKGVTIRKANDCLIAWYAMEYNLILAHDDKDFEEIKKYFSLKTFH